MSCRPLSSVEGKVLAIALLSAYLAPLSEASVTAVPLQMRN